MDTLSTASLHHCVIDWLGSNEVSPIVLSFADPNLIGIVVEMHICPLLGRT